jgi:hypothetical protein
MKATELVTVTGVADDDINNETVTISHTITGAGYAGVTSANVIASVTDDDTVGVTNSATAIIRRNRHIACWLCIKYHGVSAGCGFA